MSERIFELLPVLRRRAYFLLHGSDKDEQAGAVLDSLVCDAGDRLAELARLFALSAFEVDVLVCLAAAELDPFLPLLQRSVQRDSGRPWLEVGTISELLQLAPQAIQDLSALFAPERAFRRWALVLLDQSHAFEVPIVQQRVKLSAAVAHYLCGTDSLPAGMARFDGRAPAESFAPRAQAAAAIECARRGRDGGPSPLVQIAGSPGCGKQLLAHELAAALDQPLLTIDLLGVAPAELEPALRAGFRQARFEGAVPCFLHWESQLPQAAAPPDANGQQATSQPRRALPKALLSVLAELDGLVLLTTETLDPLLQSCPRLVLTVDLPFPSPMQRAQLLEKALAARGVRLEADLDLTVIARRYALDPRRLAAAAHTAGEMVRARGTAPTVSAADLDEVCRRRLTHDLQSVANRVTNSHRWEDLVVSSDVYGALGEIVSYARSAERVYDDWGFADRHSLSRGTSILFAGPPGTGKTMCASVIARELDMELFQVDLSRVVSKWIGETEKNLCRVFEEAERSGAIILFDEADSLFAKRTEVRSSNDRYANLEVNFLLQRMEQFRGITILTTNFEDTLDPAFKRRITFRVRFDKPDQDGRAALWEKAFPARCSLAADVDPQALAARFEMTGANIRSAAVRAAFLAVERRSPITQDLCNAAAERECREIGLLVRSLPEPRPEPELEVEIAPPRVELPARPHLVPITHWRSGRGA